MAQYTMDMFGLSGPSSSVSSGYTASSWDIFDTSTMGWSAIIGYTAAILLILLVILLFIHYTIMPIFQLQPGGPGLIPIPYMDSNQNFWPPQKTPYIVPDISNCIVNQTMTRTSKGGGASMASNWSMSLDISIMNPQSTIKVGGKDGFRLLFSRAQSIKSRTDNSNLVSAANDGSITAVISDYNIAIGLLPDTNDLLVSVMNDVGNAENIFIGNVPTQTPFRLGVVIMDNAFEVYMNGKLTKTRKMAQPVKPMPSDITPVFQGPLNSQVYQIARVGNLILWPQVITPSVMKYAEPKLMASVPAMDDLNASAGLSCGGGLLDSLESGLESGLSGLSTVSIANLMGSQQTKETKNVQDAITTLGSSAIASSVASSANNTINNLL